MKKWIVLLFIMLFASISNGAIFQFQRALQALYVSFDNATNGFTSTEVQSAIEEAKTSAEGKARYAVGFGFDGSGSSGRWLETHTNIASNISGYVVAQPAVIKELSLACGSSTTITVGIYKNLVQITTIVMSSQKVDAESKTINVTTLDELSAKIESGSCTRPALFIHLRYQ
jgi:hypothetical protein